ncbi:uncharacterized protein LOC115923580 [Strongylocentrotus purpuratus]|uniref:Nose resistant-to-fluoxetine protein N-terminal domain-containing protein n=1 Tax=Strongylocentrotus purpuratus TaxID=7668 RepID=A0A7M7NR37_STRPU|nr:uncharacterized protein LOC115923580 [Strongylocentrotus purpuratus]
MACYLKLAALLVIFTGCHGKIDYDGGVYLNDALRLWQDQSLLERAPSVQNVSDVCLQDLLKLFSGDPNLIQVLDSFGKPTPGTLVGNTAWLGHFDECMNITEFRYCLVDMGLNITISVNNTLALPISWGVCAPVSCSEDDVQNGLDILLGKYMKLV